MGSIGPSITPRILFVDAYDSFTNNIVGLLEKLGAHVVIVRIDNLDVRENLLDIIRKVDAIVIGPGPGHPAVARDVGLITDLWHLDEHHLVPILGICLGFQSLCFSYGATIERLPSPRHGIITRVSHQKSDIFDGLEDFGATQYHSLRVEMHGRRSSAPPMPDARFWSPSKKCAELLPLAWDFDDAANGPILMAARHVAKPFWGVQFHPESICTSEAGRELVSNWWLQAQKWLETHNRLPSLGLNQPQIGVHKMTLTSEIHAPAYSPQDPSEMSHLARELRSAIEESDVILRWGKHPTASISPTLLLEALGHSKDEVILLDSQGHASGRYSIIGIMTPGKTMKVTYKVNSRTLQYGFEAGSMDAEQVASLDDVWPLLQEALDSHKPQNKTSFSRSSSPGSEFISSIGMDNFVASHLPLESPFWGGFMGYISYEAGLETINVSPSGSQSASDEQDINFAFVHRSIVIDHFKSEVYIQSLLPGDWTWILRAGRTLDGLVSQQELRSSETCPAQAATQAHDEKSESARKRAELDKAIAQSNVVRPTESSYREKVLRCQDYLRSGDSYELCLTDETRINVPSSPGHPGLNSWTLYRKLREGNPAPFGAYMRLSGATVVGSSPERFLRWTREGSCQFRPIKGTVKKGPGMTRELAHKILGSSKERAENLMIVDLIRHDLSSVIGARSTRVPKLMIVEEYETVYQLVSIIEGELPARKDGPRGIDVLKASLPPGSMTGAPKKRSCEILRDIEQRPRGVYSGVLGYMDVGGAGDFSVVIRTAVRGKKSATCDRNADSESWYVGAGGAVTIQSTDEGEYLEMDTKASSVLAALLS